MMLARIGEFFDLASHNFLTLVRSLYPTAFDNRVIIALQSIIFLTKPFISRYLYDVLE